MVMNKEYKVIFHVSEKEKIKLSLNNIKNLIIDLGIENLQIELVINSVAVEEFKNKDFKYEKEIHELSKLGVKFVLCKNSLKGMNIDEKELIEPINIVPSGVGELVKKQGDGWAYIRP
ncbi:DsrE family protein [Clostridium malenominatum]|uniref:DsrE family protein n=2 Tax=Clostridium malenominatum TaxID=1539 RepID=A0ABN1IZG8_9CLOT